MRLAAQSRTSPLKSAPSAIRSIPAARNSLTPADVLINSTRSTALSNIYPDKQHRLIISGGVLFLYIDITQTSYGRH